MPAVFNFDPTILTVFWDVFGMFLGCFSSFIQRNVDRFFTPGTSKRDVNPPSVPLPLPWASLGRVLRRIPVKDIRSIMACWPLPPSSEHLFTKPAFTSDRMKRLNI
jgi:hypothetical protein